MINLLPPIEQRKRFEEKKIKLVWTWFFLLISFMICFVLMLFLIKIYLAQQINAQKKLTNVQNEEIKQFEDLKEKVHSINSTLAQFNAFYENHFDLPTFLEKLNNIFLTDICLDHFSYQKESSRVMFSGRAKSIDRIFDLRERLKQDQDFNNIKLTIPDWSQTKEVGFQIILTIKE